MHPAGLEPVYDALEERCVSITLRMQKITQLPLSESNQYNESQILVH